MKIFKIFSSFFFIYILSTQLSYSHSGGLNAQGCHNNTKTGDYHCHRSSSSSSSSSSKSVTNSKKVMCRLTVGNQYYDFDPLNSKNINLNFDTNDGSIKIRCD